MKKIKIISIFLLLSLILTACMSSVSKLPADSTEVSEPDDVVAESENTFTPTFDDSKPPIGVEREFSTDFSIHSVSYDDILSGGPPKDGIPPIDQPQFITVEEADEWIEPVEPVIQVSINKEVKAYPLQILTWHEIVNDTVGGIPVVVTFCPLCNTAIAFERTLQGQVLDFGTTGRLRFSNLIMYDRQTETWWQQATGEGIVGELTGRQLEFVPAALISWDEFKNTNPEGMVLSRNTGHNRAYGQNPYVGYDDINNPPFLYIGPETPGELPATARILALDLNDDVVAYPYQLLADLNVVNDNVGDEEIAVFWAPGTASALDTQNISDGQDVGSAVAFSRRLNDRVLTFRFDGENIIDNETESIWNILGRAVAGPLSSEQLTEIVSVNHFWFSWAAFKPETRIYQPDF